MEASTSLQVREQPRFVALSAVGARVMVSGGKGNSNGARPGLRSKSIGPAGTEPRRLSHLSLPSPHIVVSPEAREGAAAVRKDERVDEARHRVAASPAGA